MLSDCLTEVVLYVLYHSRTFSFLYYFHPLSLLLPSILTFLLPSSIISYCIILYHIILSHIIWYHFLTPFHIWSLLLVGIPIFISPLLSLSFSHLFCTPSLLHYFFSLFYSFSFLLSSPLPASPHCCFSLDACMCSLQHRSRQSIGRIGEAESQRCETW